MRHDEERSFAPSAVDLANSEEVRELADLYGVDPQDVEAAVAQVGPNRTAVELLLSAPSR